MNDFRIDYEDIPYDALAEFGLTQEMIDDLPEQILYALTNGQRTPVLPIVRMGKDGKKYKDKARIRLVQTDNSIGVMLLPCYEECSLDGYSVEEKDALQGGKVIKANVDNKGLCYVQLDGATNRLLFAPVDIIDLNIHVMADRLNVSKDVVENIKDGALITSIKQDNEVTYGIDLHSETGIRVVDGNKEQWQEKAKSDGHERYSFGLYGCWMTDSDGNMSYVPEKNYTPEMVALEAQKVEKVKHSHGFGI